MLVASVRPAESVLRHDGLYGRYAAAKVQDTVCSDHRDLFGRKPLLLKDAFGSTRPFTAVSNGAAVEPQLFATFVPEDEPWRSVEPAVRVEAVVDGVLVVAEAKGFDDGSKTSLSDGVYAQTVLGYAVAWIRDPQRHSLSDHRGQFGLVSLWSGPVRFHRREPRAGMLARRERC